MWIIVHHKDAINRAQPKHASVVELLKRPGAIHLRRGRVAQTFLDPRTGAFPIDGTELVAKGMKAGGRAAYRCRVWRAHVAKTLVRPVVKENVDRVVAADAVLLDPDHRAVLKLLDGGTGRQFRVILEISRSAPGFFDKLTKQPHKGLFSRATYVDELRSS